MSSIHTTARAVLAAWDSTVLPVANDGRLQEAMEMLRAEAAEQARPDIIERLTYHALERDDLTLDDCLAYLAEGWKRVRGRTERQMVLQLTALLAGAPAAEQAEPVTAMIGKCQQCGHEHEIPPAPAAAEQAPIDMVLHCPACGEQHIDAPEWADGGYFDTKKNRQTWSNPPHRSHLCHGCGHIWRPADVPTNGVAAIKTKGNADSPPAPARQEWQPIETAPKTGAKIIVRYVNRNNKPRTVMARWLTDEQAEETDADGVGLKGGWYECIDNWDDYTEVAIHEGEPSLWMPLPAAPITAAPAEGGAA